MTALAGNDVQAVALISLALYMSVPVLLCMRGWIITAGLVMIILAFVPMAYAHHFYYGSETRGDWESVLLLLLLPLALPVLFVGIAVQIYQGVKALRRGAAD